MPAIERFCSPSNNHVPCRYAAFPCRHERPIPFSDRAPRPFWTTACWSVRSVFRPCGSIDNANDCVPFCTPRFFLRLMHSVRGERLCSMSQVCLPKRLHVVQEFYLIASCNERTASHVDTNDVCMLLCCWKTLTVKLATVNCKTCCSAQTCL